LSEEFEDTACGKCSHLLRFHAYDTNPLGQCVVIRCGCVEYTK
jgi:hypothetical protein